MLVVVDILVELFGISSLFVEEQGEDINNAGNFTSHLTL